MHCLSRAPLFGLKKIDPRFFENDTALAIQSIPFILATDFSMLTTGGYELDNVGFQPYGSIRNHDFGMRST